VPNLFKKFDTTTGKFRLDLFKPNDLSFIPVRLVDPPEHYDSEGTIGDISYDDDYEYIYIGYRWKRHQIGGNW
jgi:hypothetical protein